MKSSLRHILFSFGLLLTAGLNQVSAHAYQDYVDVAVSRSAMHDEATNGQYFIIKTASHNAEQEQTDIEEGEIETEDEVSTSKRQAEITPCFATLFNATASAHSCSATTKGFSLSTHSYAVLSERYLAIRVLRI